MNVILGVSLAMLVCLGASVIGLGRERSFYPTVMMVIASDYMLFAAQAWPIDGFLAEVSGLALFTALAIWGFRASNWFVVAALILHGAFDVFHGLLITNLGVPRWWPVFCLTFDLVIFGAFTRLTDSGLGCPDWPGCYGHASPVGAQLYIDAAQTALPSGPVTHSKAWIEMIHRYLATGVGVLILTLAASSWLER